MSGIDNYVSDDADVDREMKKLFTGTNLLIKDSPEVQLPSSFSYSELTACAFMAYHYGHITVCTICNISTNPALVMQSWTWSLLTDPTRPNPPAYEPNTN